MRFPAFAAILAFPVLGLAPAFAQSQTIPDDAVTPVAGVDTVCGGTTADSRDAWLSRGFAMRLEFVGKGGQYLGGEDVTITGKDFRAQVQCQGPWLMMDLPPGAYHVSANVPDAGTQELDLTIVRNARRVSVLRFESAGGTRVTTQANTPEEELATTNRLNSDNAAAAGTADAQYQALKKQYEELSKSVAARQAAFRAHQDSHDALTAKHDELESQSRALTQQCSGLQAVYDALEKRRTEEKNWTVSRTQSYLEAQNDYTARKSVCDENGRRLVAEQAQYQTEAEMQNALIARDRQEDAQLQAQLAQAKKNLDAYIATAK